MLPVSRRKTRTANSLVAGYVAVLSLCPVVLMSGAPAWADPASMEERIQRVEDEKEIRDLMVQYGQYLDSKNFAGYSQLFARNGEWSGQLSGSSSIKGPDMIRSKMEEAFAERIYDPAHITNVHMISNIKIDIDGDRATGYSKWTVMSRNDKDEPYIRLNGHYDDVYIREDGLWKFLSRAARRDIP